jgi:hypothetical protein
MQDAITREGAMDGATAATGEESSPAESVLHDDLHANAYDLAGELDELEEFNRSQEDGPGNRESSGAQGVDLLDKGNEPALSLRARLAEMFGLSGAFKLPERQEPPVAKAEPVEPALPKVVEPLLDAATQSVDEFLEAADRAGLLGSTDAIDVEDSVNDENYVSEYVARLLGRTGAPKIPEPSPPDAASGDHEENQAPLEMDGYADGSMGHAASYQDPLDAERHLSPQRVKMTSEALRANMDSFRELANISARSAVARSQFMRVRTRFSMLSAAAAVSWIAELVLFVTATLRGVEDWSIILSAGAFSLTVTALAALSYRELKKLEATIFATSPDDENE